MALQILRWSRAHHSFSHPKARYMVPLFSDAPWLTQALILDDVDFGNRQHVLAAG
ncbi:hypothetical protein Peur_055057 [Populus x canadensis]